MLFPSLIELSRIDRRLAGPSRTEGFAPPCQGRPPKNLSVNYFRYCATSFRNLIDNYSLLLQAGLRKGRCTAAGYPPTYHLLVKGQEMRVYALQPIRFQLNAPHPSPLPLAGEGMQHKSPLIHSQ